MLRSSHISVWIILVFCLLGRGLASEATREPKRTLRGPVKNRPPFQPQPFALLPLGAIKPRGWLLRQLQIQASGLTGHLDEFWPDVGDNSAWLGGTGEAWERGPYYLDGLVALAYALGDEKLIAKAKRRVDWVLDHQTQDGWLGPIQNKDLWPNMVLLKSLTQYFEATGDERVPIAMKRYFDFHLTHSSERKLTKWGRWRWADELLSVLWLYNRIGDAKLLELARALHDQGGDWKGHFETFTYLEKSSRKLLEAEKKNPDVALRGHGVNNAMALKVMPLWWLVSGDYSSRGAIHTALSVLDAYHPQPNGMFSADEHYAGPDPSQGIELCAVVEAMFSLEQAVAILGEAGLADRLEKIAYNALPATFSKDMWAHQYDQQPNQVMCSIFPRAWSTNGAEANVFGLEPNFGCCTANMHQGWPKLVSSLWMATDDEGLAAVAYAPSVVKTRVKDNVPVTVIEETEYPFRDEIRLTVNPSTPVNFPLVVRIPTWADGAKLSLNGKDVGSPRPGTFHRVDRIWKKGDRVRLRLPMSLRTTRWPVANGVVVERGPLVFSLKVGEEWRKITKGMSKPAPAPAADWEVTPTTPWNYALMLDPVRPADFMEVIEAPIGEYPFSPEGMALILRARGRRLASWSLQDGSAGPLPPSPVTERGPSEAISLIPYGSAKLRITVFPWSPQ